MVESDPAIVSTITSVLTPAGYCVLCAESPIVALVTALYRESPIDLLVSDVNLPEMSGAAFAREFARYHPETRALFIGTEDAAREAAGLGYPLLTKPFTAGALIGKVQAILGPAAFAPGRSETWRVAAMEEAG